MGAIAAAAGPTGIASVEALRSVDWKGEAGPEAVLAIARSRGLRSGIGCAGEVTPDEAWTLFSAGVAVLVDIRTAEERKFVGYVPGTPHVAWATGMSMLRNPRFLREVEAKAPRHSVVLLLCRSAKRSAAAAEAMTAAGWAQVYNVLEGFEGDLDEAQHRGVEGGWRHRGLPWVQD
jgi:rhodanese-related sulfurtransferase